MTIVAQILETYETRKTKIAAINIKPLSYVLGWPKNHVYVGGEVANAHITGFENAILFGDKQAAVDWQRHFRIGNGINEAPVPMIAFNAQQHSIHVLEDCIKFVHERAV